MTNREKTSGSEGDGPSWGWMLTLLGGAILIAAAIAYRLIYPFFHVHPR